MRIITGIMLVSFFIMSAAMASGRYHCADAMYGKWYCPRDVHGSATRDSDGNVFCGHGECMADQTGDIMCSRISGGGAARDPYGAVLCQGGCEQGSKSMCDLAE